MTAARRSALTLAAVCLLGFALRVVGLQYGLPAVYNPDEVSIMARALSFARGTLNPHNFLYPTFYFYVMFAWVGAYLAWVWLSGRVASIGALQQLYFTDPTGIYTAGRALGVAAGTATILGLYGLAARLTDPRTAIAAAIFLAVSPLHVRDSHYVKHDVPATLAVVLAYVAMTRIWPSARPDGPRQRDTVLAGAACGVAFSTHYYCVFLAIPLALVIVQGWKPLGWISCLRQLTVGALTSAVVFLALSPFLLVEPLTAWRDITANRQIVIDRAVASGAFGPAGRYLEMLWRDRPMQWRLRRLTGHSEITIEACSEVSCRSSLRRPRPTSPRRAPARPVSARAYSLPRAWPAHRRDRATNPAPCQRRGWPTGCSR